MKVISVVTNITMIKELKIDSLNIVLFVSDDGHIYNNKHKEYTIQRYKFGYCYIGIHQKSVSKNLLVHRLVAAAFIQSDILERKDLDVHHLDEDKSNNCVSNLQVMTKREHQILHNQKYPLTKICEVCGKEFTPNPTKRKRAHVCSNECKVKLDYTHAAKRKRPINQYNKKGEFIKTFNSARDVQNELGYFESNINKVCNGKKNTAYGYIWRYADESS